MKHSIQLYKDEKAMTIAEIIVSVFILALIAAIVLPGLLFGYRQVHDSGEKSSAVQEVQMGLEQELLAPNDVDPTIPHLQIQFGSDVYTVEGKLIKKEVEYDSAKGSTTEAKVFIPD
ncbi:MAG: type II secretion system protein [Ruminiclostridium sp.]|nr:type II secretion system protein [Ruminiclostridium sp.]